MRRSPRSIDRQLRENCLPRENIRNGSATDLVRIAAVIGSVCLALLFPNPIDTLHAQCAGYELAEVAGNPTEAMAGKEVIFVHGFIPPSVTDPDHDSCADAAERNPEDDYWHLDKESDLAKWEKIVESLQKLGIRVWTWRWPTKLSMSDAAFYLRDAVQRQGLADELVLVGHSFGGLVSLDAMTQGGNALRDRTLRVVTLGTPHNGTDAYFSDYLDDNTSVREGLPGSLYLEELEASQGFADLRKTYVFGGEVPDGYGCITDFDVDWDPSQSDCIVRVASAYNTVTYNGVDAYDGPLNLVAWQGGPFQPYDHSQIKLDYTDGIPDDGRSGLVLADSIRKRVLLDLIPEIELASSSVSLFSSSPNKSVAVRNKSLGSIEDLQVSVVSGTGWLSASLSKMSATNGDPALVELSAWEGTLQPATYTGRVEVSGLKASAGVRTTTYLEVAFTVEGSATPSLSASKAIVNPEEPFTLDWTSEPEAERYILQEASDSEFSSDISSREFTTTTTETTKEIRSVSTTKYYRVRAQNSDWSNIVSVSTNNGAPDGNLVVTPSPITTTGYLGQGSYRVDVQVGISGVGSFDWSASPNMIDAQEARWLELVRGSDAEAKSLQVVLDASSVSSTGTYDGTVTFESGSAENSPVTVDVRFEVRSSNTSEIDLTVSSSKWIQSPGDDPSDPELQWQTKNVGNEAWEGGVPFRDRVYRSRDGTLTWSDIRDQFETNSIDSESHFTSLLVGGSVTTTVNDSDLTPPEGGQWYYYIVTDFDDFSDTDGVVPESNDTDGTNSNNLHKFSFWMPGPPKLRLETTELTFNNVVKGETRNETVDVFNDGYEELEWSVQNSSSALTFDRRSGAVGIGSVATLDVYVDTDQLSEGTNDLSFTVSSNGGSVDVQVTVDVSPPPEPPTASFDYSPADPLVGESIEFNAGDSSDPDGTIAQYRWDFDGDGQVDDSNSSATTTHTYSGPDTYTVRLTVEDEEGETASTTRDVTVRAPDPPTATFDFAPGTPEPGQEVDFDASGSSDPNGTISTYQWDFGDGNTSSPLTAPSVSHAFGEPGEFPVTLTVTDADGLSDTHQQTVSVQASQGHIELNDAELSFSQDAGQSGSSQTVQLSNSGTGELDWSTASSQSFAPEGVAVEEWLNVTTTGSNPLPPGESATIEVQAGGSSLPAGSYAGEVLVSSPSADNSPQAVSVTLEVTAVEPPAADFTVSTANPVVGEPVVFDASASTDADGSIVSYLWEFGDGNTSGERESPDVAHTYSTTGEFTVTLTVVDDQGLSGEATETVVVEEPAPGDLQVASVQGPASALAGETVAVTVTTINRGETTVTQDWRTRLTMNLNPSDGPGAIDLLTFDETADLAPGESVERTVDATVSVHAPTFDYHLVAIADDADDVAEADEGNNEGATAISVTARPDLSVSSLESRTSDVAVGSPVTVDAEVANRGEVSAPATWSWKMLLSEDQTLDAGDTELASGEWGTQTAANSTSDQALTVTVPSGTEPGPYRLLLQIDTEDSVDEGVEDNNSDTSGPVSVTGQTQAPNAAFSFNPSSPQTGEEVQFDASGSSDADGSIAEYWWDFDGDGETDATTVEPVTTHTYSTAGTYSANLTVVDNEGATGATTQEITVAGNAPPSADFTVEPSAPVRAEEVTFDASGSADSDGSILEYRWDFDGDGEIDASVSSETSTHVFSSAGTFTVELTVLDDDGATGSTSHQVTIGSNDPPTAAFQFSPSSPSVGETVTFDASGSGDPDGTIADYRWDFDGDGETDASGSGATTDHSYPESGTYTVELTVIDDGGATDVTTQELTVEGNEPPTASFSFTPSNPAVGEDVTFDAANSNDPDGSIGEYRWDFDGDGSVDTARTSPTASHAFPDAGNYTVSLVVEDNDDATGSTTREVVVQGAPRIALADTAVSVTAAADDSAVISETSLTNTGGGTLDWSIASEAFWISLSPASGTLASDESAAITLAFDLDSLDSGTHQATMRISAPGAGNSPREVPIEIVISPPVGEMVATPEQIDIEIAEGIDPLVRELSLTLDGSSELAWKASSDAEWLSTEPTSGRLVAGDTATISLTVDRSQLSVDRDTAELSLSGDAQNSPLQVPITVEVVWKPEVAPEAVADHLIGEEELTQETVRFLDLQGNRNGRVDVGDLRAFLEGEPSASSAEIPSTKQGGARNDSVSKPRLPVPRDSILDAMHKSGGDQ